MELGCPHSFYCIEDPGFLEEGVFARIRHCQRSNPVLTAGEKLRSNYRLDTRLRCNGGPEWIARYDVCVVGNASCLYQRSTVARCWHASAATVSRAMEDGRETRSPLGWTSDVHNQRVRAPRGNCAGNSPLRPRIFPYRRVIPAKLGLGDARCCESSQTRLHALPWLVRAWHLTVRAHHGQS
jgi:hypothetical protein